ncbi:MAG: hypothetical protein ACXABY_32710 [Candidatus Thorarchaeota archaeon]|jgi:hypothetical protein
MHSNAGCNTEALWCDLESYPWQIGVYITDFEQTIGGALKPEIFCPLGGGATCDQWSQVDDLGNFYPTGTLCLVQCAVDCDPDICCNPFCVGGSSWTSNWDAVDNYRESWTLTCFYDGYEDMSCDDVPAGCTSCPDDNGDPMWPGTVSQYSQWYWCDPAHPVSPCS